MGKTGERGKLDGAFVSVILSDLAKQKTLASPLPHLQFLLALSHLAPTNIMPPPPLPSAQASSSRMKESDKPPQRSTVFPSHHTQPTRFVGLSRDDKANSATDPSPSWAEKGKSKAEVLKAWRISHCKSFPDFRALTCSATPVPTTPSIARYSLSFTGD